MRRYRSNSTAKSAVVHSKTPNPWNNLICDGVYIVRLLLLLVVLVVAVLVVFGGLLEFAQWYSQLSLLFSLKKNECRIHTHTNNPRAVPCSLIAAAYTVHTSSTTVGWTLLWKTANTPGDGERSRLRSAMLARFFSYLLSLTAVSLPGPVLRALSPCPWGLGPTRATRGKKRECLFTTTTETLSKNAVGFREHSLTNGPQTKPRSLNIICNAAASIHGTCRS